ncbi:hypothetical protein [Microvirga pudoricolor]|uniref:hypothetical protein n=1 Tax=Microvirga pudoricolor TaxID=2778729 RepID=UPI001951CA04|nr:hypothetical protein [Microvirga pudoricolor]MBM6595953.1 hypothetical protein [Microvirga pudoricolor]
MHRSFAGILASLWFLHPGTGHADILAVIIDAAGLPYDLSPNKYDNSPDKYDNSSDKYDNSVDKYDNSPSKYDNSPAKYDNGINGKRRVISQDNKMLGYYVFSPGGVLNFYNMSGKRIAYMPAGGRTQSIFTEKAWCGTMGNRSGAVVLGLTKPCYYRFILNH